MDTGAHWLSDVLKDVQRAAKTSGFIQTEEILQSAITALAFEHREKYLDSDLVRNFRSKSLSCIDLNIGTPKR